MSPHRDQQDAAHAALRRVRREGRWWWLQARHARRVWRWALLVAVLLFMALVLLRRPLANWFWNEPQIEQLLDQGDRALAAGRLSAADGSGAREWYQAALALDGDRSQARTGLARTAQAALQQARDALDAGDLDAARRALALARELQVPQRDADQLAQQLQQRGGAHASIAVLLGRAEAALQAQRLDDGPDSALPLFQQVLAVAPNQLRALEGREDALSDLLLQARSACASGELATAATLLGSARRYDPGHVDLPQTEAQFNAALEQALVRADRDLARGRTDAAWAGYRQVAAAAPSHPRAQAGLRELADRQARHATRLAGDFRFPQATQALEKAKAIDPQAPSLATARTAIEQARHAQQALRAPQSTRTKGELRVLLERFEQAQARGDWLLPPGRSAYDALRAAQALAPADPAVRAAAHQLVPVLVTCFDDELRRNRVRAAGDCLQAWQALAAHDNELGEARRRLGRRWLAIGSERLGAGDARYAREALEQAAALGVPASEIEPLQARLRDAATLER